MFVATGLALRPPVPLNPRMSMNQLKKAPGHLLRRAQQASTAMFSEEMLEYELTSVQFLILAAIMENDSLDATRLAEIIDLDRATLGAVIERLERKGLVDRCASPADRRVIILKIRPHARALVQVCQPRVERVQERLLEPLSAAERDVFLRLLAKVAREDEG